MCAMLQTSAFLVQRTPFLHESRYCLGNTLGLGVIMFAGSLTLFDVLVGSIKLCDSCNRLN